MNIMDISRITCKKKTKKLKIVAYLNTTSNYNVKNIKINKTKDMKILLKKLINPLTKRIKMYHELFSLPLIAEQWEETLHRSILDIGYTTSWKPLRSHMIGEDMRINEIQNSRISCKSGQLVYSKELNTYCVKFNGSRTTSYETLENKINHLSKSHDDYYFMLSKNKTFDKKYKLLVFKSSVCNVNKLNWCVSKSKKSFHGKGDFTASISNSMSGQLWTTLPLTKISYILDIDCS